MHESSSHRRAETAGWWPGQFDECLQFPLARLPVVCRDALTVQAMQVLLSSSRRPARSSRQDDRMGKGASSLAKAGVVYTPRLQADCHSIPEGGSSTTCNVPSFPCSSTADAASPLWMIAGCMARHGMRTAGSWERRGHVLCPRPSPNHTFPKSSKDPPCPSFPHLT